MSNSDFKEIQIVAFAVPYPANYGGVIDVYYRLKTFFEMNVKVHLHAFVYDDHQPSAELERLCASVQYYKRENTYKYLQNWPYILSSRYNKLLINSVLKIGKPVLLEGLHTCFLIEDLKAHQLPFVIRMHNIEWKYYSFLAELEPSFVKKKYFLEEARRLKKFEQNISSSKIIAISDKDAAYLKELYPSSSIQTVMPFHDFDVLNIVEGIGDYAIFHGNLAINENEKAAIDLVEKVFLNIDYPLIVAGKNPTKRVAQAANAFVHKTLEANPTEKSMTSLMKHAHIHILPNRQPTGMKIKWVNALYTARFIIVHPEIFPNTIEEAGIYTFSSFQEIQQLILRLKDISFTQSILEKRKALILERYNNTQNANKILSWL
ncbi:MAG: hypothetical protein M9958_07820 [Chitinophagales bacterium]|nr:hypothetical protein [Chitinophagales bacterium]